MAKDLAARYLAGLTPDQIKAQLPNWLAQLNEVQFAAAWEVAQRAAAQRAGYGVPK